MNEHRMTAVVYAAPFFETSGDAECHPDVAVKQLEQLAYFVRQLSPGDQEEFRQHGHWLSADQSDPLVAEQVRAVVDSLVPPPVVGCPERRARQCSLPQ